MTPDVKRQLTRAAREHGARAAFYMRMVRRAGVIAAHQGAPCVSAADLNWLAGQAWANAKLAAHHALIALNGQRGGV